MSRHVTHNPHGQVLKSKLKTDSKQLKTSNNYSSTKPPPNNRVTPTDPLKAREEAYRKRNAELQVKSSTLVQEAQDLLSKQLEDKSSQIEVVVNDCINMKSHSSIGISNNPADSGRVTNERRRSFDSIDRASPVTAISNFRTAEKYGTGLLDASETSQQSIIEENNDSLNLSDAIKRVEEKLLKGQTTELEVNESCSKDEQFEDVYIHEEQEPTIVPQKSKKTLANSLSKSTLRDIVPSEDLGGEAIQRFLKAKLNVLQEELDSTSEELAQRETELQQTKKELNCRLEQQQGLDRQVSNLRLQNEKQKKKIDELTKQLDASQNEVTSDRNVYTCGGV